MLHPCCGSSLQTGTKTVAIVEIVCSSIAAFLTGIAMFMLIIWGSAVFGSMIVANQQNRPGYDYGPHAGETGKVMGVAMVVMIAGILIFISRVITLVLSIKLLNGAIERDPSKCRPWLIYTAIMWVLSLASLLIGVWPSMLSLLLDPYFMWVVHAFIKELENGPFPSAPTTGGVVVFYTSQQPPNSPPPPYPDQQFYKV